MLTPRPERAQRTTGVGDGGPYYAPNPLRGGAPKGARSGRFWIEKEMLTLATERKVGSSHLWANEIVVRWGNER